MKFDSKAVDEILSDYSIYHPSPDQVVILYDLAEFLSKRIELIPVVIRNIIIRAVVRRQKEKEIYHFKISLDPPQFKMSISNQVIDEIKDDILKLLENPTERDIEVLNKVFRDLFQYYSTKYATRDIEEV